MSSGGYVHRFSVLEDATMSGYVVGTLDRCLASVEIERAPRSVYVRDEYRRSHYVRSRVERGRRLASERLHIRNRRYGLLEAYPWLGDLFTELYRAPWEALYHLGVMAG